MEAELKLYDIIFSFAQPMALKAAVLLNIPGILANSEEPLSVPEIASLISSSTGKTPNSDYLARIIRFLSSHGVFDQTVVMSNSGEDVKKAYKYGSTSISKLLVEEKGGKSKSSAALLLMETNRDFMEAWHHLYDCTLMGGSPFERGHGMNIWDYANLNPHFSSLINDAMASNSAVVMDALFQTYEGFEGVTSLVDVAGGVGSAASMIVHKYPNIRAINFDLPHVIASAPRDIPGVDHVAGDMFESVPSADVVLLKWVLHDWDDEEFIRLLKNCYKAIPEKGKVIIIDAVVEENGSLKKQGLAFDMFMMAHTHGGKERTEEEYKILFQAAGFRHYNIIKLPFVQAIVELVKS
ncbi:hypothetical protein SUGI_0183360 [Cryptomeria japonica]|uniref:flavone 3'-O-methyltransferase 1 n=1 Tax=Cryptomeria japonica TaxID=3369 RepID=UPI002408C0F4|nr:flavone 3'-O-methyltransferase 1 [Cryptomeria japonica]GLJ12073.1 hypothetical protein SUGI_0183360 [Cryptomeria japonica]